MTSKLTKWELLRSTLALDNRWFQVRQDIVRLPNGQTLDDYYYWDGGHYAIVFALTTDGAVLLVRQYKHGIKEIVLELPAGMIESDDVTPEITGRRELYEETGYQADEWLPLSVLYPSPAKATTRAYAYLARGAYVVGEQTLDRSEAIEVIRCPLADVITRVMRGEIREASSIATISMALHVLRTTP